jgi:threonyl-tRNA synthetase
MCNPSGMMSSLFLIIFCVISAVTQADYPNLEKLVGQFAKEKQPFERLVLTKENLLEMFKHNPYKVHIINDKIPDGTSTTVYRCGPLIDLCRGPHVPNTGRVKAFTITKNSASYFLGDANNDSLQRLYGISFPDKKQMTEYKKFIEEAAKRDHRKIGKVRERQARGREWHTELSVMIGTRAFLLP